MADTSSTTASTSTAPASASAALLEARPPATDRFTYLTLIEENLSPELLPTLHEVLQDAQLTQEIGWDLVDMLVPLLPASEACLDDVARLGNPREVILKVLEVLEGLRAHQRRKTEAGEDSDEGYDEDDDDDDEDDDDDDDEGEDVKENAKEAEASTQTFVVLLGMLGLLHRRIQTKRPSRFLESTLRAILAAYRPERPAMTTAVLGLVRSLAARRRPPPPIRRSTSQLAVLSLAAGDASPSEKHANTSTNTLADAGASSTSLATLARSTSAIGQVANNNGRPDDAVVSVPDPEAEDNVAPDEGALQQRLLQSFVTCILEAYVNANDMAWAPRLLEHYHPEKLVPGRPTILQSFREDPEKVARESAVGQLVALALDLGLKCSDAFVHSVCSGPVRRHPLTTADTSSAAGPDAGIPLSTGGTICLLAYWAFSAEVFQADAPVPALHVFPDHHEILEAFLAGDATSQIARTPGTIEAIVVMGLWLDHNGLYEGAPPDTEEGGARPVTSYMEYHHLLTLCAVFHPSLIVRHAATTLAGAVLHADPDPDDRLKILQDLLENCMFASLKACAITWLREEIMAAGGAGGAGGADDNDTKDAKALFATPDAVEQLQYAIFPDLQALREAAGDIEDEEAALLDYWVQNAPFLLQAANLAFFLFHSEKYRATVVPPGMGPAVEQRFVEPLLQAAARIRKELQQKGDGHDHDHDHDGHSHDDHNQLQHVVLDLDVLSNRLSSVKLS